MLASALQSLFSTADMPARRPMLDSNFESNIRDLYIVGDLAGAPVVKLAMEQGYQVAKLLAGKLRGSKHDAEFDVVILGAGAAGLNAAMTLQDEGLRAVVIEQRKIASTIEDFPEGKWIYAEPESRPNMGPLWLMESQKEDLLQQWHSQVRERTLDIRTGQSVQAIRRGDGRMTVKTDQQEFTGRYVILATGQRGTPRRLNVPGDDQENVSHRLYSPRHYENEKILVVGGGNSAIEAALVLAEQNQVTLSYRGSAFSRVFKDNSNKIQAAQASGKVEVIFDSNVTRFDGDMYELERKGKGSERRPFDHAFILIGADLPTAFLKSLGIKLENEWTGNAWVSLGLTAATMFALSVFRGSLEGAGLLGLVATLACLAGLLLTGSRGNKFSWLGIAFLVSHAIYGAKQSTGFELWPYTGWGNQLLSFSGRPWSFWYTVLYTAVMTVFGLQAMKRWGFDKKDNFQIWRYSSLIGFQWLFFFIIPEFLFRIAVDNQWIGAALAKDPQFAQNAWRSYGLVYAWPLFFYTFFDNPHMIWVYWGLFLSFILIPVLAIWHGKRYCSWVCGCGGLAETLGDQWRHLAPKGMTAKRWERMNIAIFGAAVLVTVLVLGARTMQMLQHPAQFGKEWYHLVADTWLVGIIPVTLYPFLGGKIWCRYWCPLAKMMEWWSGLYARLGKTHFAIHSNDKCIACGECTRYCQVGIDVMSFATMQKELNNANSSCIGCGICVTVCPMDVLSFTPQPAHSKLVRIAPVGAR